MAEEPFGIRDGEIAVELPENFDASLYFIGHIRTPWTRREDCPKNARESDAVCTILVDERWAKALTGVETCSHLVVLYWMSRSRRDLVLQMPRHYGVGRGTFALRSPARTQSYRPERCAAAPRRRHEALGRRARLSRQHPAPRHQTIFCLNRRGCRRGGWLACGAAMRARKGRRYRDAVEPPDWLFRRV